MTPRVSVVMSVYNDAPHLAETIESVLSQEGVDLELVIVNDGSSDGSAEVLAEYARRDPRVRVVEQENQGLTRALIRGCALARAPYIARQDAGDLSLPGRLRAQVEPFDADAELAFVSCWTEYRGPAGEYLYTKKDRGLAGSPREIIVEEGGRPILLEGPTSHASVVFRKSLYDRVGGYRAAFHLAQDWDLWYRLAEVGRYQAIASTLYVMRISPTGLSNLHRPVQHRLGELARRAFEERRRGEPDDEIVALAEALVPSRATSGASEADGFYFIGEALRRNGDDRCRAYFRRATALSPFHIRSWARLAQTLIGR